MTRGLLLATCCALGCSTDPAPDGMAPWDFADAALPDGRVVRGPYATRVVSFTPGEGAGFGRAALPDMVLGPPQGAGARAGSTDVVSLGAGGEIVLAFDDVAIVDGEGPDFLVFENPFEVPGTSEYWEELGRVSVSDDGRTWRDYPCAAEGPRPHVGCAGWNPVYARADDGHPPTDPATAGGDPFDLRTVGLAQARYLRIRDLGTRPLQPPQTGFDLDAVAIIHGRRQP